MRLLITAGPTCVPIDSVRVITNLASGRTGFAIASLACALGHPTTLLISRQPDGCQPLPGCRVHTFSTPEELAALLSGCIQSEAPDVIVHSAAVSDFRVGKITNAKGKTVEAAKLDSGDAPFQLELLPAPKLLDSIRRDWGFRGLLVGFKLESGLDTPSLVREAETTRLRTGADFMVANHQHTAGEEAFIGPGPDSRYQRVERSQLPKALLSLLESRVG